MASTVNGVWPLIRLFSGTFKELFRLLKRNLQLKQELFDDLGIKVVHSRRLQVGVIGDEPGNSAILNDMVRGWLFNLSVLTMIANTQPQAAYAALTISFQNEWS